MKEIFLLKLGEIVLKGANKRQFENKLRQNVRRRMKKYGNFDVYILQSTVYVEPMDEEADVDGAWEACRSIFGVVSLCRCRPCEKDLDAIFAAIENYLGDDLDCAQSFKVESKRSDKRFPLNSIQISQEIGGRIVGVLIVRPSVFDFSHFPADTFCRIHRIAFHTGGIILRQERGVVVLGFRIVYVYCVKHIFAGDDQIGHSSGRGSRFVHHARLQCRISFRCHAFR